MEGAGDIDRTISGAAGVAAAIKPNFPVRREVLDFLNIPFLG